MKPLVLAAVALLDLAAEVALTYRALRRTARRIADMAGAE